VSPLRLWLPALAAGALTLTACGSHSRYVPSGTGGVASVISTPRPAALAPSAPRRVSFTPSPAAVSLSGRLSLAQQVGQLFMPAVSGPDTSSLSALGSASWGGVVFTSSAFQTDGQIAALAADVAAADRSAGNVAPLLAVDQPGGPETAIPDLPPGAEPDVGAQGLPSAAYDQALSAGRQLRALGFNMTIAPLVDVDSPGGPLNGQLFSSDPVAVARFSLAAVNGYASAGLISAPGHFPGEGAASADPDQIAATVGGSLAVLRARDLVPFTAVAPRAPVILMSNAEYAAFDGVTPAGLLPAAVKLLRSEGFGGVVMSDDLDATLGPTGLDPGTVAVRALQAGDDLLYISGPASEQTAAYDGLLAAAQRSPAILSRVHDALLRVLSLKARYGLLG
jgi:beta-N-acetylhexosaminidase